MKADISDVVSQIAVLLRAEDGWDAEHSQPLNRIALANYLQWFAGIPDGREFDAYPMITDTGHIRLEWTGAMGDCVAEIGPNSLWFCSLGPSASGDQDTDVEIDSFDECRLTEFFEHGTLGGMREVSS